MAVFTNQEIDDLADELISVTNRRAYAPYPHGESIEPHVIYLYYVDEPNHKPEPYPRVYVYDHGRPIRNQSVIEDLVTYVVNRACDANDNYKPVTYGFNTLKWNRRSYVVIVVDSEGWEFRDNKGIVFDPRYGKTPNHTFFDGFNMTIALHTGSKGSRRASAACFTNYMIANHYGDPLVYREEQEFKFWMFPKAARQSRNEPIDPGGTNLGPPAPPP